MPKLKYVAREAERRMGSGTRYRLKNGTSRSVWLVAVHRHTLLYAVCDTSVVYMVTGILEIGS